MMFAGLRSRCTSSLSCRYCNAGRICRNNRHWSSRRCSKRLVSISWRSVAAQNSIWMYNVVVAGFPVKFDDDDIISESLSSSSSENPSRSENSSWIGASSRPSIQACVEVNRYVTGEL